MSEQPAMRPVGGEAAEGAAGEAAGPAGGVAGPAGGAAGPAGGAAGAEGGGEGGALCPMCGYDCRGLPEPRCPECGQDLTIFAAADPRLVWPVRERIGLLPAFHRTVALVLLRPWQLAAIAQGPVDDRSARRFLLLNAGSVAMVMGGACVWFCMLFRQELGLGDPEVRQAITRMVGPMDLLLPMELGMNPWTIGLAVMATVYALPHASMATFGILRQAGRVHPQALRAASAARYLSAGLLLVPVSAALLMLFYAMEQGSMGFLVVKGTAAQGAVLAARVLVAVWAVVLIGVFPLYLLRRVGAELWHLGAAAVLCLVQLVMAAGLAVFCCCYLFGLIQVAMELLK